MKACLHLMPLDSLFKVPDMSYHLSRFWAAGKFLFHRLITSPPSSLTFSLLLFLTPGITSFSISQRHSNAILNYLPLS